MKEKKRYEAFLDTPRGSNEMTRQLDRPCRYAPAFRVSPSCVFIDDAKSTRLGSFDAGEMNRLFKDGELARDTVVITSTRCLPRRDVKVPSYSDLDEPYASYGAFPGDIGRVFASLGLSGGRRRIICSSMSEEYNHMRYSEPDEASRMREESVRALTHAGVRIVEYDDIADQNADGVLSMNRTYLRHVMWGGLSDATNVYRHYLDAVISATLSNFEFLYVLYSDGQAIANTTFQRDGNMSSTLLHDDGYFLELVDAMNDAFGSDVTLDGYKPNLLDTSAVHTMYPTELLEEMRLTGIDSVTRVSMTRELTAWYRLLVISRWLRTASYSCPSDWDGMARGCDAVTCLCAIFDWCLRHRR